MRHVFSVIRFVPNPVNGEFVNIGMLVGSQHTGEWKLGRVTKLARARRLGGRQSLESIVAYLDETATQLRMSVGPHGHTQVDGTQVDEAWLSDLARRQQNMVQFTSPLPVEAESCQEVFEMLWDRQIVTQETRRRTTGKERAVSAVREVLSYQYDAPWDVWQRGKLETEYGQTSIDFVVNDEEPVFLAQCWSFMRRDTGRLIEEIQSWAWAMESLRLHGGVVSKNGSSLDVAAQVGVAMVYVPPNTDDKRTTFTQMQRLLSEDRVGTRPIVSDADVELFALAVRERVALRHVPEDLHSWRETSVLEPDYE